MLEEVINLRNYAHLGDAVWEIFVREFVVFRTSNAKTMHKMTTDRVNATFQANLLQDMMEELTEEEQELARRARNLSIPVARRPIQHVYRQSTAFEVLIGYWYLHNKPRLESFYDKFKTTEFFS